MDFLWNGYGFRILKNTDYGMGMDSVLNPSGPTGYKSKPAGKIFRPKICYIPVLLGEIISKKLSNVHSDEKKSTLITNIAMKNG